MLSLNERLMINVVDHEELQSILLDYLSRSFQIAPNKFGFGREDGNAALIVHTGKDGRIVEVGRGPAFAESEIDDLAERVRSILTENATPALVPRCNNSFARKAVPLGRAAA